MRREEDVTVLSRKVAKRREMSEKREPHPKVKQA